MTPVPGECSHRGGRMWSRSCGSQVLDVSVGTARSPIWGLEHASTTSSSPAPSTEVSTRWSCWVLAMTVEPGDSRDLESPSTRSIFRRPKQTNVHVRPQEDRPMCLPTSQTAPWSTH